MSSLLEDSFIAAPTPGGAAGPAHAAHDVEICGVPTKIALTAYSNRVFVVVTQTDNLGTLIAAERDLAIDPTCTCYSTRVLLGRRDDETLECTRARWSSSSRSGSRRTRRRCSSRSA